MIVPILVTILVALCGIVVWRLASVWRKYRGHRAMSCPEDRNPAGVTVDLLHVMATSLGRPQLRLESCSRWPEKSGCGQGCLREIAASPETCLVRNILLAWYVGKVCCSCEMPIGEISMAGAKPGVLPANGSSVEWREIPAEKLQQTLLEARPICFACHAARKMLREHRELI